MLIELKDGDTIVVNVPRGADQLHLVEHFERMAPPNGGIKVLLIESDHGFRIEVYRPPVAAPAPVEESDGWFAWESAPRDGQEIDVWIEPRGRVPEVFFTNDCFQFFDDGEKCSINRIGTPTHWRYPPKGPKA